MKKYLNTFLSISTFFLSVALAYAAAGFPSASESVELELSVRNCNYNAICEPLLGENYEGCDLDCEPPPAATTIPEGNGGNRSGNRRFIDGFVTSLDPLWQINQQWVNDIALILRDITTDSFTIGWQSFNTDLNYFKLVKSPFRYPLNDTDGFVVYEGRGSEVRGEDIKNLYFYGLFQRVGENLYVPRIYFSTPSAPALFSAIIENIPREITPREFPQQSQTLNVGEIELFQNESAIPVGANMAEVKLNSPVSVIVNTDDDFSSKYNLVGSISPISSDSETLYQFQDAGTGQRIQIPALNTAGDYVLRVTVTSKDGKQSGVSNILIHYDPQNPLFGLEKYCRQTLISAKYLCFTAVGNQILFLAEKIIKIW